MNLKHTFSSEHLEKISELLIKYLEIRTELIKIQLKEQIARVISQLILVFILLLFSFLIILMASFAISMYLNYLLDSLYLGYVICAGFYVLILILLTINRKKIIRKIVLTVIEEEHEDSELNKKSYASEK